MNSSSASPPPGSAAVAEFAPIDWFFDRESTTMAVLNHMHTSKVVYKSGNPNVCFVEDPLKKYIYISRNLFFLFASPNNTALAGRANPLV